MSGRYMDGFDEYNNTTLVAGSVTGLRAWVVDEIPEIAIPISVHDIMSPSKVGTMAYRLENEAILKGAWGYRWNQGVNEANCSVESQEWAAGAILGEVPLKFRSHKPPSSSCGCGFWAYWGLSLLDVSTGWGDVIGVIKGYGKTLLGAKGFRCEKAEILALTGGHRANLPPTIKEGVMQRLAQKYGVPVLPSVYALLSEFPPDDGGLIKERS